VPVPPGDQVLDVDLRDPGNGRALVSRACRHGRCVALSRTVDGGRHWQRMAVTDVPIGSVPSDCRNSCGATRVAFANPNDGYLFGPGMYTTSDGGRNWRQATGPTVDDLAVEGRTVVRIVHDHSGCPGPCKQRIQRAMAGGSSWVTATIFTGYGAPGTLALSSTGLVYALFGDNLAAGVIHQPTLLRSPARGITWTRLTDGCAAKGGSEAVAVAAAAQRVALLCADHGGGAGANAIRLSADEGATFSAPHPAPVWFAGRIAMTARRIFVATSARGGQGPAEFEIAASQDDGQHWKIVVRDAARLSDDLSDSTTLAVSATGSVAWIGYPFRLWVSTDNGTNWVSRPAGDYDITTVGTAGFEPTTP